MAGRTSDDAYDNDGWQHLNGVSVVWLATTFGLTRAKTERLLRPCPIMRLGRYKKPLYDIREAVTYLVTPKMDLTSYLATLKPDQLPDRLKDSYWSAKLKQQRYMEKAGHLWHDADVLDLVGQLLQDMRMQLQILPENAESKLKLNEEQYLGLRAMVEDLQDEYHRNLVEKLGERKTLSQAGEEAEAESEFTQKQGRRRRRDSDDVI